MAIAGFPVNTLNEHGEPRWIDELATVEGTNHLLNVVRGLAPEPAVELVGGRVLRALGPDELPAMPPDDYSTVAHGAVGADRMVDLLVAGSRRDRTFGYDTGGVTGWTRERAEMACLLSANGRTAATSILTINCDASLYYAEDGNVISADDVDNPDNFEGEIPDALRLAIASAGSVASDDEDSFEIEVNMRIACAPAGPTWTVEELRWQPLVVPEVMSSKFHDMVSVTRRLR
jgi:hypothetical protein